MGEQELAGLHIAVLTQMKYTSWGWASLNPDGLEVHPTRERLLVFVELDRIIEIIDNNPKHAHFAIVATSLLKQLQQLDDLDPV